MDLLDVYFNLEGLADAEEYLRRSFPGAAVEFESPVEPDKDKGSVEAKPETSCLPEIEKAKIRNFRIDITQI